MAKRLSREEKQKNLVIELINEMFKIAGHRVTYYDVEGRQDAWFNEWTMTEDQYNEWQTWGTELIRKKLGLSKTWAKREMAMIGLNWGLKFERNTQEVSENSL
jgi:hypothetical protein